MIPDLPEDFYKVFSKYTLQKPITGCDCALCLDEAYTDFLHKKSLRHLTGMDLCRYIESVDIIDGTCNDFKYFFPKIVEIIYNDITNPEESNFCIFIWKVLAEIDYTKWTENEIALTVTFFTQYWNATKSQEEDDLKSSDIESIKTQVFQQLAL